MIHDMDLDAAADASSKVMVSSPPEMLLEIGEPADDAAAPLLVAQVQRIVPKREPEARKQPAARAGPRLPSSRPASTE